MKELLETDSKEKNIIYGYSERGIINSLIFTIGEDKELLKKFIELISLPEPIEIGNPKKFTILLEQSFSEFGDADLVIIIHYEKEEDKKVLFFEAKVKTYLSSWNITSHYKKYTDKKEFKGYSSNLFYQLYFKTLLMNNLDDIIAKQGVPSNFRERKIGNNKIVNKAVKKLKGCKEAYYIGIIPTFHKDIKAFLEKNDTELHDNDTELHFLSWKKVYSFCKDNQLNKVLKIFKYNKGQIY